MSDEKRKPYRCPSCGCTDLPPLWRKVIAEYKALGEREQRVVREILTSVRLYGQPKEEDWINTVWDVIRELLPTYCDADAVSSGLDRTICYLEDGDADLLPPAWSSGDPGSPSRPSEEACRAAAWTIYERLMKGALAGAGYRLLSLPVQDPERSDMIQRWALLVGNACDEPWDPEEQEP